MLSGKLYLISITALIVQCHHPIQDMALKTRHDFDATSTSTAGATNVITGRLTSTGQYCGGAAPSEEILAWYSTPHPMAERKLYLISGEINSEPAIVVDSTITDTGGIFVFQASPGKYLIIDSEQHDPLVIPKNTEWQQVDETCYKNWWAKGMISVEMKFSDIDLGDFNFHYPCFINSWCGCISYTGPYPP